MDSDTESESEIHGAGECFLASTEQWIEDDISEIFLRLLCIARTHTHTHSHENRTGSEHGLFKV